MPPSADALRGETEALLRHLQTCVHLFTEWRVFSFHCYHDQ